MWMFLYHAYVIILLTLLVLFVHLVLLILQQFEFDLRADFDKCINADGGGTLLINDSAGTSISLMLV